MPHSKLEDLAKISEPRWPSTAHAFQSVQWGDMEVAYTTVPKSVDCTDSYRFLPGGVCLCPHYGYLVKGRLRCTYPGVEIPDEVVEAGEVYFFPAGHVLIYEEETTAIEFNPAAALQQLMASVERWAAANPEVVGSA